MSNAKLSDIVSLTEYTKMLKEPWEPPSYLRQAVKNMIQHMLLNNSRVRIPSAGTMTSTVDSAKLVDWGSVYSEMKKEDAAAAKITADWYKLHLETTWDLAKERDFTTKYLLHLGDEHTMAKGPKDIAMMSPDGATLYFVDAYSARDLERINWQRLGQIACEACGGTGTIEGEVCWHCEGDEVDPLLWEEAEKARVKV